MCNEIYCYCNGGRMDEEESERKSTAFPKGWPYNQMAEEETSKEDSEADKKGT